MLSTYFVKPTFFFWSNSLWNTNSAFKNFLKQACWVKKIVKTVIAYIINYAFICEQLRISFSMRFHIHILQGSRISTWVPLKGKNYSSTACISYLVNINATWHNNYRAFLEPSSTLLHSGAIMWPQTMITCSRRQWKTSLCHLYSMEPIYQSVWNWQRL